MPVTWHTTLTGTQHGYWEERPCTVSEGILTEREQKQCCIEGILQNERTQNRIHVNKWIKDDDEIPEHWWFRCGIWERKETHPYGSCRRSCWAVADRAERAPSSATSARVVTRELGVPWSTVRKILRCILHRYPYKTPIVQQLKPHDPQQRLDFALQFLARMEVDDLWPDIREFSHPSRFAKRLTL